MRCGYGDDYGDDDMIGDVQQDCSLPADRTVVRRLAYKFENEPVPLLISGLLPWLLCMHAVIYGLVVI
jgi:hypothetical protein